MPILSHPSIWLERLGRAVFTRHDKNADGKITEDEAQASSVMGEGRSRVYDANNDGIVSQAEYVRRYSANQRARMEPAQRLQSINTAIQRDPSDPGPYSQRGDHHVAGREYDQAITDYTQAISLDPNDGQLFSDRGYAWYEKKEYDKAIESFEHAAKTAPPSVAPRGDMAPF
jgi:tetratricopeptide (TPR) repeat protein